MGRKPHRERSRIKCYLQFTCNFYIVSGKILHYLVNPNYCAITDSSTVRIICLLYQKYSSYLYSLFILSFYIGLHAQFISKCLPSPLDWFSELLWDSITQQIPLFPVAPLSIAPLCWISATAEQPLSRDIA